MKYKNNIIVMAILIFCISICFLGCSTPKKDTAEVIEQTIYDEDELLNVFIEEVVGYNSDYLHFLPDDYDGDGNLEAFGITGYGMEKEIQSEVNIWFINSKGKCIQVASNLHGSLQDTVDTGSDKFIVWENLLGDSKNASYIYGCKNTKIHEPEISGCYERFRCADGKYYAEKHDFIKGYRDEITHEFTYDVDSKEFVQHI